MKQVTQAMMNGYGTMERYQNHKQEQIRKETEKNQQPKSALDLRVERLRAKQKAQPKEKKRERPDRNRGFLR